MGGMPYHLEKGPYWSLGEAVMNSSKAERYRILEMQRQGLPLTDLAGPGYALTSTSLYDAQQAPSPQAIAQHGEDFMGGEYTTGKKWSKASGPGDDKVGFRNYHGDIEGILRITFIRAIEVSLGLKRDETLAEQPPARARFWPIEYVWKCPTAWVEGWVTWQRAPEGSGHVTVHLLTPSHDSPVLTKPEAGRNAVKEPKECDVANGMWVVTHRHNKMTMENRIDYSEFGNWNMPTFGPVYTGTGPIVTVAPSEADGGVLPWGRSYVPPAAAPRKRPQPTKKAAKKLAKGVAKRARKKVGGRHG